MERITEEYFKNNLNVLKLNKISKDVKTKDAVGDMNLFRKYLGINENNAEYDNILDDLFQMDKPFVLSVWEELGKRASRQPYNVELDLYLCGIRENNFNDLTWGDSKF